MKVFARLLSLTLLVLWGTALLSATEKAADLKTHVACEALTSNIIDDWSDASSQEEDFSKELGADFLGEAFFRQPVSLVHVTTEEALSTIFDPGSLRAGFSFSHDKPPRFLQS